MSVGTLALADVVVPNVASRLLEALGSGIADQAGPLWEPFVTALSTALGPVDELVTEGVVRTGPDDLAGQRSGGISDLFNLDRSPNPGWLGQWVGVPYVRASTRAQQIAAVRTRGTTAGTPDAIRAAVLPFLSTSDGVGGVTTKRVRLRERTTLAGAANAYQFVVEVFAAQVGSGATADEALLNAIRAAVTASKPVGLLFDLVVLAGGTFADTTAEGKTFAQHKASGRTFAQRSRKIPAVPLNPTFADTTAQGRTFAQHTATGRSFRDRSTPGGT